MELGSYWLDVSHGSAGADGDYNGFVAATGHDADQPKQHHDRQTDSPFKYHRLVMRTVPASSPEFQSLQAARAHLAQASSMALA